LVADQALEGTICLLKLHWNLKNRCFLLKILTGMLSWMLFGHH